jgi:hypothetical protein
MRNDGIPWRTLSPAESVATDAMREAGLNTSLFHARCVDSFRAGFTQLGKKWDDVMLHDLDQRLENDMKCRDIDHAHSIALWDFNYLTRARATPREHRTPAEQDLLRLEYAARW